MRRNASSSQAPAYRIFLSHAGEDKETIARPLYHGLRRHGLSVFLDEESFRLGDDCPKEMDDAMQTAPIGIFILSPEFVAKYWPMRELLTFVRRYESAIEANETPPLLVSVFYRFMTQDCRDPGAVFAKYANLFYERGLIKRMADGVTSMEDIAHALDVAAKLWSIRNDSNADNSTQPGMRSNRESFVEGVLEQILEHLGIERRNPVNEVYARDDAQREQRDVYKTSKNVPPNPPGLILNYDTLSTCEGELKAAVLREPGSRIVAVVATGKGGVGKTCALRGLADDDEIRDTFTGGILYIQLGNDAKTSDLIHGVADIIDRTGGEKLGRDLKAAVSVKEACDKASKWFESQKCLFLIDDIWKINGIDANALSSLGHMVNTSSRMVYTTRDAHFLSRANKLIEFEEKEPFSELSHQMLMKHADFAPDTVLDDKNMEAFKYFLGLCHGLPLGFGIVGSSVRSYSRYCSPKQDAWSEFHKHVLSKRKDLMNLEVGEYGRLPKIVDLSLEVLQKRNVNGNFEQWFRALCVVAKQQSVPAQMLQKLWSLNSIEESETVVERFAGVSIVQMMIRDGSVFLTLHDMILDIACRKAAHRNETQTFFRTLALNYVSCGRREEVTHTMTAVPESERVVEQQVAVGECHDWWDAEDDGYMHKNVCRILRHAGCVDELLWLLSQPQWVVQRLLNDGFYSIEQDLEHGNEVCRNNVRQHGDRMKHLEVLGMAARLSSPFVNNNRRKEEGWFQMHGRLLLHAETSELTSKFVKKMEREAPRPWVKASIGLLQQADSGVLGVVQGPGCALCIREEEDEMWILWYGNGELHVGRYHKKLFRHAVEQLKAEREDHSNVVRASFSSDGRSVLTGHVPERNGILMPDLRRVPTAVQIGANGSLVIRVWSRETGALERCVEHKFEAGWRFIDFCAEGTLIAMQTRARSHVHSIRLFDTLSGAAVEQPLEGHTDLVSCVASNADGTRILLGSSSYLRVWDAESGSAVGQPLDHPGGLICMAMSADGTHIALGLHDNNRVLLQVFENSKARSVWEMREGHMDLVSCVAMNADGTRIVSGSHDKTVRVWAPPLSGGGIRFLGWWSRWGVREGWDVEFGLYFSVVYYFAQVRSVNAYSATVFSIHAIMFFISVMIVKRAGSLFMLKLISPLLDGVIRFLDWWSRWGVREGRDAELGLWFSVAYYVAQIRSVDAYSATVFSIHAIMFFISVMIMKRAGSLFMLKLISSFGSAEVSNRTVNGSRVVLGTCEAPVVGLPVCDGLFVDRWSRWCRIIR